MVDTVAVDYLYPPGMLDGSWDDKSGNHRVVVQLRGLSDGTGETDVIKVVMTDLKTPNRLVPNSSAVEKIEWQILGMTVALEWDRAPHSEIVRLNAHAGESYGCFDWMRFGGRVDYPGIDDRTGDILLTSTNFDAGDSYDITVHLRLKDE